MQSGDSLFSMSNSCFLSLFSYAQVHTPLLNTIYSNFCSSSERTRNSKCSRGSSLHSPLRCKAKCTTRISGAHTFQSEIKLSQIISESSKNTTTTKTTRKRQNQATTKKERKSSRSFLLFPFFHCPSSAGHKR